MVRSFENQGKIQVAIDSLKVIIEDELGNETIQGKLTELMEKLKTEN